MSKEREEGGDGKVLEFKAPDEPDWTPRRALVELLEDIDRGDISPEAIVISYVLEDGDGIGFISSAKSMIHAIGILESAKLFLVAEAQNK